MKTSSVFTGCVCLVLSACGGGGGSADISPPSSSPPPTFTIGGSVAGLTTGTLVVQNNGGDTLTVSMNGSFRFGTALASGNAYQVKVLTQPANQQCSVSSGAGTVAGASVTNIAITCADLPASPPKSFKVGGNVAGLTGTLVLTNNGGGDTLSISQNGPFAFGVLLPTDANYQIAVSTQPANQQCSVTASSGKVGEADVMNIAVTCVAIPPPPAFSVGGTVSGLAGTLTLRNNGNDVITVASDGVFTFPNRLATGASYLVEVQTAPINQQCAVTSGGGTIGTADALGVVVTCRTSYTVGGNISGLSGSLVLQDDSGEKLTLRANGSFAFSRRRFSGDGYQVTLLGQPPNQYCRVRHGSGVILAGNVSDITVACNTLRASRYAYVVTLGDPDALSSGHVRLSQYAIGADGTLAPLSPSTVTTSPQALSVAVDPTGSFAYVTDRGVKGGNGSVWQYTIGADGTLTPMSAGIVPAGLNARRIAFDPSGRYAYVVNFGSSTLSDVSDIAGTISEYSISANGSLVPLSPSAVVTPNVNPTSMGIDPTGRYAYVTGVVLGRNGGRVLQYSIGADGALTPLNPDSIDVGVFFLDELTPDPFGRSVWFTDSGFSYILQRAIQDNGTLGTLGANQLYPATISPTSFGVDPTGTYAYSGAPGSISLFHIAEDGGLTLAPNHVSTSWVNPIAIDGAGRYLYAGAGNPENKLLQYSIGSDGMPVPLTPASVATDVNPIAIALSP